MGITRFLNKTKQPNHSNNNKTRLHFRIQTGAFRVPSRLRGAQAPLAQFAFPARQLHASQASFCVQRLLPATRTPGHTVATRNLSQYPLKFSKALQPRLHSRRHPTGKRHRRRRSFLHSVSFPALWGFSQSSIHPRDQPPGAPPSAPQRSLPRPGTRAVQSPAPRLPPQRLGRSGPRLLDGLARPRASRGLVARGRAGWRRRL